ERDVGRSLVAGAGEEPVRLADEASCLRQRVDIDDALRAERALEARHVGGGCCGRVALTRVPYLLRGRRRPRVEERLLVAEAMTLVIGQRELRHYQSGERQNSGELRQHRKSHLYSLLTIGPWMRTEMCRGDPTRF